ncbi:phytoene/squalene synthase family protein [Corynebacterium kroppenstedtii]|uniref:phytoene/squalene synthase family protein n=1 Tax=Corynebacterium sp. PCR 32 TaxID=3351342 RepID=UPI0030999988
MISEPPVAPSEDDEPPIRSTTTPPASNNTREALYERTARLYDRVATQVSSRLIATYSTSFTVSTRLLSPRVRHDIHNLYGVVRIADEVVDGAAAGHGLTPHQVQAILDDYEQRIVEGITIGFSTDPIIHAFITTARTCRIDPAHLSAFFRSMRADVAFSPDNQPNDHHRRGSLKNPTVMIRAIDAPTTIYDANTRHDYVYGSAEVIGLMCLSIFLRDESPSAHDRETMETGARHLGAAFQKINFLRDYALDIDGLNRDYVADGAPLTDELKDSLLQEIYHDLTIAQHAIPLLPISSRIGVRAVHDLFAGLAHSLDRAPASTVRSTRVRTRNVKKVFILAQSIGRGRRRE